MRMKHLIRGGVSAATAMVIVGLSAIVQTYTDFLGRRPSWAESILEFTFFTCCFWLVWEISEALRIRREKREGS